MKLINYAHARITAMTKGLVNYGKLIQSSISSYENLNNSAQTTRIKDQTTDLRAQTTNLLVHFLREAAHVQRALLVVREVGHERHLSMVGG